MISTTVTQDGYLLSEINFYFENTKHNILKTAQKEYIPQALKK